jgi:hypothetical protein
VAALSAMSISEAALCTTCEAKSLLSIVQIGYTLVRAKSRDTIFKGASGFDRGEN